MQFLLWTGGTMTEGKDATSEVKVTLGHSTAHFPDGLTSWESLRLGNKGGDREGLLPQTSQNTGEQLWEWGQYLS